MMENMYNLELHTARLAAALRVMPKFSLSLNVNDNIVMCEGDNGKRIVLPCVDGIISKASVYNGQMPNAEYLSHVTPLLFNGYEIHRDGIYGVFEDGVSRMVSLEPVKGEALTKLDLLTVVNMNTDKAILEITNRIIQHRRHFVQTGVKVEDGAIKFCDAMHTAVHELTGDEHTEETILETVERLGYLPHTNNYSEFVDLYVELQYKLPPEYKEWLIKAMTAIMYMIRSELSIVDNKHISLNGHVLPMWLLLSK